jgi:uncharacterized protein YciI
MVFVFMLIDRADATSLRQQLRPAHKTYLAQVAGRIAFAGPLLADDGQQMTGSLLAIDFDSRTEAEAWLDAEPFTQAGLYARREIHAFTNLWPQRSGFPPAGDA